MQLYIIYYIIVCQIAFVSLSFFPMFISVLCCYLQVINTFVFFCNKDKTTDILCKPLALGPLPEGLILATIDVESLYSTVPHEYCTLIYPMRIAYPHVNI